MADYNCSACDELRQNSSDFYINGVTDSVCTQLQNDKGFSGKSTDCEDLDDANDCLIRGMESEIDAYDACDWQEYMHKFVGNVWTVIKAIICSICGLWKFVNKHECELNGLLTPVKFKVGEDVTESSYLVAGKGVSYLARTDEDDYSTDITFTYIGGGLARLTGGLVFHTTSFKENSDVREISELKKLDPDNDGYDTIKKKTSREGNENWGKTGDTVDGNELIYEVRLLKSQYPRVKSFYSGFGQEANGHGFHVSHNVYTEGEWAAGQHGACDDNGKPKKDGYSYGHKVPEGWIYIQMRMSYIFELGDGDWATPRSFLGMRLNNDDC